MSRTCPSRASKTSAGWRTPGGLGGRNSHHAKTSPSFSWCWEDSLILLECTLKERLNEARQQDGALTAPLRATQRRPAWPLPACLPAARPCALGVAEGGARRAPGSVLSQPVHARPGPSRARARGAEFRGGDEPAGRRWAAQPTSCAGPQPRLLCLCIPLLRRLLRRHSLCCLRNEKMPSPPGAPGARALRAGDTPSLWPPLALHELGRGRATVGVALRAEA